MHALAQPPSPIVDSHMPSCMQFLARAVCGAHRSLNHGRVGGCVTLHYGGLRYEDTNDEDERLGRRLSLLRGGLLISGPR